MIEELNVFPSLNLPKEHLSQAPLLHFTYTQSPKGMYVYNYNLLYALALLKQLCSFLVFASTKLALKLIRAMLESLSLNVQFILESRGFGLYCSCVCTVHLIFTAA